MSVIARPGLRVTAALIIPEAELDWRFSRSSGPGGQGVNTTDSRVELSWSVTDSVVPTPGQRQQLLDRLDRRLVGGVLTVAASEQRAQLRNRETARQRLAELLAAALAPPPAPRRPTGPSRGARQRRLDAKKRRGSVKRDRRSPGAD